MARFKMIALALALLIATQTLPVHADKVGDCILQANPGRAIAACTTLLKANSQNRTQLAALYQLRAIAYDNKGHYNKAIADYSRAIKIKPGDEVHYNRGFSYFNKQQYGKAIADFSRAVRFNPKMVNAYYNRGLANFHLRRFKKAINDFSRTIRLDPKLANAYRNRAVAYKNTGQNRKAVADFKRYMRAK